MNLIIAITLTFFAIALTASADPWLELPAKSGTAIGKKIVIVTGDEEYRSEESGPMLAKILSQKHGFDCSVLFAIHADGGYIDPNDPTNLPGTELLDAADLMIIQTRFRNLPATQLTHFEAFLNAGKPVIGLRTATHAFNGSAKSGDFKWSEFGLKILGEKWVSHHGDHGCQGTRSFTETANRAHPILNGVGEIFGTTDVYTVKNLDPAKSAILLRGGVTTSLESTSPLLDGPKNQPMMPLAWTHTYTAPNGQAHGQAFCTTLGAATDFNDENLRRLVVNAAYELTGTKVPEKADVTPLDPFTPSPYKAINNEGFYKKRNLRPEDFTLGKSPSTLIAKPILDSNPHAPNAEPAPASSTRSQAVAPPSMGERIILLGNGLAERDLFYGRLETEIYLRNPSQQLIIRNMGRPGDTPGFRPHPARTSQWAFPGAEKFHPEFSRHDGKGFFPTPDQWLTHLKADTIVAFFGFNESFDGEKGLKNFEAELDAFVIHTLSKAYNGIAAPRLVLASPIAYEDQSQKHDLPNGTVENANLKLYTAAIERVSKKHGVTFVDLFTPTAALYSKAITPFTTSGYIPTEAGYQDIAKILSDAIYGPQARDPLANPENVHAAVQQKNWFWQNDYKILNGVHVYGQRYKPYGPQNYPDEVQKTREMLALRDNLIHEVATGKTTTLVVDDSRTHELPPVPTNFKKVDQNDSPVYLYGKEAESSLSVPAGYKVELFASEKEFPNLANPMQISFDNRGRLWVATMPTYPAYRPGDAAPNDKILIYEDTDGDGKADKETVFADHLHLPIGLEFAPEGVYISEESNLILLSDTDHDDHADTREIVLGGFDTHDTHHAISAYCADPSGAFLMGEGVFLHSNVETAYGPVRAMNGGFFRYEPQRRRLERTAQLRIPNPWGIAFDSWGQDFFLYTSGPRINWMLPASSRPTYGSQSPSSPDLTPKGQAVRPTSGLEFISSRHFPDEVQGDILLCNTIGFLGIKEHQITDSGTGYKTDFRQNLLSSSDGNFRPVDLEFAPDGSLYVVDWHNVLVGHMQHNARDPLRDHVHGRIYRITYPSRPLITPAPIEKAAIATLLENLKLPEYRTRYRSRRELRAHPAAEVLPVLNEWVSKLDTNTSQYEHHLLEALWTTWGLNQVSEPLLTQLLQASDFHVRAAAVRVLRYNTHRIHNHVALLEKAAGDPHGRVRLEAVIAASWLNSPASLKIITIAAALPLDEWSKNAVTTATNRLKGVADIPEDEHPAPMVPPQLTPEEGKQFISGHEIYFRDAHCATCHQPDGKGIDPAFPPLAGSEWVTGDPERLVKLTLHGLMGPFTLNGKSYPGLVPMTAFGGILNDAELADVLTYIRNDFGNTAPAVTPKQVTEVRAATRSQQGFFQAKDLSDEPPVGTP